MVNKEAAKDTVKLGLFMVATTFMLAVVIYYFMGISL